MAVAVKNTPETAPRPINRLAVQSLAGIVYVLGSLGVAFYAVPRLWVEVVSPYLASGGFVDVALRGVGVLAVAFGLAVLGRRLLGTSPLPGVRAGIFVGVVGVVLIGLLTAGVGRLLERNLSVESQLLGLALTVVLGGGLLVFGLLAFFRPTMARSLVRFEEQGWFEPASYKRTQGQRVRRGTLLAVLLLFGTGIWTLISHRALEFGLGTTGNHWRVTVPFTDGAATVTLLTDVRFTLPILLALAALWVAYRVVNFPPFADFLIATEAEMNKVSWPTAKRLKQDTMVVLTTVVLMTLFIFAIDLFWGWGLSTVGVLHLPKDKQEQAKQAQW